MFSVKDIKSSSKTLTKEQVVEMFPNVFDEGLGLFEGEYQQPPIKPGETVRIRVPGSTMWQPAISIREVTPRSYDVRVGETVFPLQSKRPLAYRRGSTVRYAFGPLNFTVFKRNYASARRATYSVRTHRDQPSLTPGLPEAQSTVSLDLPQVLSPPVRRPTRQRGPPVTLSRHDSSLTRLCNGQYVTISIVMRLYL